MTSKMDQMLNSDNFKTRRDQPEKQSSWNHRCSAHGCPMEPSTNNGQQVCKYHAGQDVNNWGRITEAIKKNAKIIRFLDRVLMMSGNELHRNFAKLVNASFPYDNKEPYSLYLVKFEKWLTEKIYNDASE